MFFFARSCVVAASKAREKLSKHDRLNNQASIFLFTNQTISYASFKPRVLATAPFLIVMCQFSSRQEIKSLIFDSSKFKVHLQFTMIYHLISILNPTQLFVMYMSNYSLQHFIHFNLSKGDFSLFRKFRLAFTSFGNLMKSLSSVNNQ